MEPMTVVGYGGLALLGLVAGSFAGAQVWRLRLRQLRQDKQGGEAYDKKELKQLEKIAAPISRDRSRCLHCGHELATRDLIPLVSWLSTRGRCRYCRRPIGRFEPLMELGVALAFVVTYVTWPYGLDSLLAIAQFGLVLVAIIVLAMLYAYDAKWYLLPDVLNILLVLVALLVTLCSYLMGHVDLMSLVGGVAVLTGLYAILYVYSGLRYGYDHTWIGFGDVKLSIGLSILLADWRLALLALFLANFIGTLIVLPGLLRGRLNRQSRMPFGPLLIVGTMLAYWWGSTIIERFLTVLV